MKNIEQIEINEKIELPENIKEEIKKNVTELKNILKDDPKFANELIDKLHLLKEGNGYADTFLYYVKEKYPVNYKLLCVVNELAYLTIGEHKVVEEEFFMSTKPLRDAIEEEIIHVFTYDTEILGGVSYSE
jgi:hypothetical protein